MHFYIHEENIIRSRTKDILISFKNMAFKKYMLVLDQIELIHMIFLPKLIITFINEHKFLLYNTCKYYIND